MVRLFVGGLAQDITSDQLASRFQTFGKVTNSTVIAPKENDTCISSTSACRGFGYLDLEPANESALRKCLTVVRQSFVSCILRHAEGSTKRGSTAAPPYHLKLQVKL